MTGRKWHDIVNQLYLGVYSGIFYLIIFFVFYLFRVVPTARGQIRAVDTGQHHSHSNARTEPFMQTIPQLTAT